MPMGPSHACGAIEMDEKLAMAATFQSAVMPPNVVRVGSDDIDDPSLDQLADSSWAATRRLRL